MIITPVRRILLSVLGAGLLAASLVAGPWEPLFNGTDLAGWKVVNGTAPYVVADGAIVGTTVAGSPNTFLVTEKTYGDFIFECEVKQAVAPSNSGIMFRALSTPDYQQGRVHGYQMELDPSVRAWSGGIYDEARRGWFYPGTLNPAGLTAYRYGEWNHLRIEAIGPVLRTWINGVPIAHVVDGLTPAGFLGLQVHSIGRQEKGGQTISWRNLRIQTTDLQPSPPDTIFIRNLMPNTLTDAERTQGWWMLWDGKTSRGWRGAQASVFPAAGWSLDGGELTVLGKKGGSIVTEEEFSAFELQLDFQVAEGANSGIKYLVIPADAGEPVGFEFQLLDDERHPDAKQGRDGNRTTGSLYDLIPRAKMPGGAAIPPKAGAWQHARIVVSPTGHVEHWLNGIKVVEYERGSPDFAAKVAVSKYANIAGFGLAKKGPILLQDHGDVVKFRSIKIRPL